MEERRALARGLAEALDVGVVLGFDHDAGEGLGAGIAEDDAATVAESGLGFGEGAGNLGRESRGGLERTLTLRMTCG